MLKKIRDFAITGKEKAAVVAVVSFVLSYTQQNGLTLHDLHHLSVLRALVIAFLLHQVTYWTQNTPGL